MNHRHRLSIGITMVIVGAVALAGYMVWKGQRSTNVSSLANRPNIPAINLIGTSMRKTTQNATVFNDINNSVKPDEVYKLLKERLKLQSDDSDNDGLSDLAEVLLYGTNPFYHDSDLDGQTDGAEVAATTNPTGSDATWTQQTQDVISQRKKYWKTDFALSAERVKQSEGDLTRINKAGKISFMLATYYQKKLAYPVASTWTEAWDMLAISDAGKLFGDFKPLDTFGYTSDGKSYTFSYVLDGTQQTLTQKGQKGKVGSVIKTATNGATNQPVSWIPSINVQSVMEKIISPAYALSPVSVISKTTDGVPVEVYGDQGWATTVSLLRFDKLIAGFLVAAQHGGGYCDSGACYCANGTTIAFGTNNAVCSSISVPTTVVAGQKFPVTVTMRNTGQRFWSTDTTPHRLGFWSGSKTLDDTSWGLARVDLPVSPVRVGESATFTFQATAPAGVGSHYFGASMLEEGREWFGEQCKAGLNGMITITDPAVSPSPSANATASPSAVPSGSVSPTPHATITPTKKPTTPTPTFNPGNFGERD